MHLHFDDLDGLTRLLALDELWRDGAASCLYRSPRLTDAGWRDWPVLLQLALLDAEPKALATALRREGRMRELDLRGRPLPPDAPRVLADGEFNRYYCRAVCRRALAQGSAQVQVFRAREVLEPRRSSQEILGMLMDAAWLLDDLRRHPAHAIGRVPGGPGSGISVRIPMQQRTGATLNRRTTRPDPS